MIDLKLKEVSLTSLVERGPVSSLVEAVSGTGHSALYLRGSEFDGPFMQRVIHMSRQFFTLPGLERRRIALGTTPSLTGYVGAGAELTEGVIDHKESLEFAQQADGVAPKLPGEGERLLAENLWPSESHLPEFRAVISEYQRRVVDVGHRLFEGMVRLGLTGSPTASSPPGFGRVNGARLHWRSRLLLYSDTANVEEGQVLVAAHTDVALFNILHIDASGLEVRDPSGRWLPVAPRPGCKVVMFGELASILTGGRREPCIHRVVYNRTGQARLSFPFFFYPPLDLAVQMPAARGGDLAEPRTVSEILLERIRGVWPQCFSSNPEA